MPGIHAALDDPAVNKVVCMKSAQWAWTDGVLLNFLGKRIDTDPAPMIVMFAKDQSAREFNDEKFTPMVEVTPRLAAKIPITRKRDADNRQQFKGFPGGFLKFVGSNSPASVKSTPASVVAVEEPDDCNENVREQGDTITLLEERAKTFARRKIIFGGTPTIDGVSRVQRAYQESDQRRWYVPCDSCGDSHILEWENVQWSQDEGTRHEIYGHAQPETARYACPHCGALWDDRQKNKNVQRGEWRAHAAFHGTAGFWGNELMSPFPGSTLADLVRKHLAAKRAMDEGDDSKMRAFVNSSLGRPYKYDSKLPAAESLAERAEDYEEFTVPFGALVLTMGVDVQHDRLAVSIRGWGRDEESWLIHWGEIYGNTLLRTDPCYSALDALLERTYRHASGASLKILAGSMDSGDGQSSDAVYAYCRDRRGKMLATKGSSNPEAEIYRKPKESIDVNSAQKAHKYGLRPYIVGVSRAKDLLLGSDAKGGRIKLTGHGPGRMHHYKSVRADYFTGLLSEVKVPSRVHRHKLVWQKKAGVANEPLDCEILTLHSARHLKLHLAKDSLWSYLENKIRQPDLALSAEEPPPDAPPAPQPQPASAGFFTPRKKHGLANWYRG